MSRTFSPEMATFSQYKLNVTPGEANDKFHSLLMISIQQEYGFGHSLRSANHLPAQRVNLEFSNNLEQEELSSI